MKEKLDFEGIKDIIENKDGILLKEETIDKVRYITIKCNKDQNVWTARLSTIKNKGCWCRECFKRNKIKKVDYSEAKKFIENKGFQLFTPPPFDFWSEIEINCPKHNHKWTTRYGHFERDNSNCKYCGHGAIDNATFENKLKELNFTFIERIKTSDTVRNIKLNCPKHKRTWTTNVNHIMKNDRICYYCARTARKTQYPVIKKAVEDKKGILLTENCVGSLTEIEIKCKNNHTWTTKYDYINQGYWCPQCPYIQQTLLCDIIKELFPKEVVKYNYKDFKWLKDKKQMEIDIWVPNLKLAIEYDGEQHFQPVRFASEQTDEDIKQALKDLKKRDKLKNKLIARHPQDITHFIRINYKDILTKENIIKILKAHNALL